MKRLIAVGAGAAVLGGVLRIATTFIAYDPHAAWLEALYGVTDISLLFGLIGVGLFAGDRLGALGFVCFLVAIAALASIVGPDSTAFGIDFYRLGAGAFALALAGLAAALLGARMLVVPSALWIVTAAAGIAAALGVSAGLAVAGVALGAGFILAGFSLRERR